MKFACYIIYSKSRDRYYIGYTSDFEVRLQNHINGTFGKKSFTSRANDWELFLLINCRSIEKAIEFEKLIKKKKSRKFLENLKKYPDLLYKISQDFI